MCALRMNTRMVAVAIGRVPGFVEVAEPDAELDEEAVTKWAAPKAPRGTAALLRQMSTHRVHTNLRAKGTLIISEPRFSTPCDMRFFPRDKGKMAFFEGFS